MASEAETPQSHPGNRSRRVVLVRHGKPEIDKSIDRTQWSLSESSTKAARSLGERLKARGLVVRSIASSPETKAFQTAQAIASALDQTPVEVEADLSEHKRSNVGFVAQEDFEAGIARLFTEDPSTLVFGEEIADKAIDRFRVVIQRKLESSSMDVIAVTHGTILSLYIGRTLGIDSLEFWRRLEMPMAVVISGDSFEIIEAV